MKNSRFLSFAFIKSLLVASKSISRLFQLKPLTKKYRYLQGRKCVPRTADPQPPPSAIALTSTPLVHHGGPAVPAVRERDGQPCGMQWLWGNAVLQ